MNKFILPFCAVLACSILRLAAASAPPPPSEEELAKATILQLTSIFENSTTVLKYTYVENIHDERGFTFGFPGFTSGTFDGTLFLKEYQKLNPANPLVSFIPAFEAIDRGPHDAAGRNSSTLGLDDFPKAFASCGDDPAFKRAQHALADSLYWNPSQAAAKELGLKTPLAQGELYDAFINHGEGGVVKMINRTNIAAAGTPKSGVVEKKWLETFLQVRLDVLKADKTWNGSVDRIRVYQTLLHDGNLKLKRPIKVQCYGDTFTVK